MCKEQPQDYLLGNAAWCLPANKSAFCLVHKCKCPVNPGWAMAERLAGSAPQEVREKFGDAASRFPVPKGAWWASDELCTQACGSGTSSVSAKPLQVNISSLICLDYSPLGLQKGLAGESREEHAIWLGTRRINAVRNHEDLYFTECSSRYRAKECQAQLESTHRIVSITSGAWEQGHAIRRRRSLCAGLNRETLVWCGPESPEEIQKEFELLYHRRLVLDASIYFIDSDEEAYQHHAACAQNRRGGAGWVPKKLAQDLCGPGSFRKRLVHHSIESFNDSRQVRV